MDDQDTIWDLEKALDRVSRDRDAFREAWKAAAYLTDRYRAALVLIADQQSGVWGQIAHEALNDTHREHSDESMSDTSPTEGSESGRVP